MPYHSSQQAPWDPHSDYDSIYPLNHPPTRYHTSRRDMYSNPQNDQYANHSPNPQIDNSIAMARILQDISKTQERLATRQPTPSHQPPPPPPPPNRANKGRHPVPNDLTFRGEPGESFADFHMRFALFLQSNEITDAGQMNNDLASTLRGRAWAYYATLPPDVKYNYDTLLRALRERYENVSHTRTLRDAVRARKQGPNESVDQYTRDMIMLINALKPDEDQAIEWYVAGLRADIRAHVDQLCPVTLDDAERFARKKFSYEPAHVAMMTSKSDSTRNTAPSQPAPPATNDITALVQHLEELIKKLPIMTSERRVSFRSHSRERNNDRQRSRSHERSSSLQCSDCGRMGHQKAECRQKLHCTNCDRRGHEAAQCRSTYPPCKHCGRKNHSADRCWQKQQAEN